MKTFGKLFSGLCLIIFLQSCADRFELTGPNQPTNAEKIRITGIRVDFINFTDGDNKKWDVEDDSGPDLMFVYGEYDSQSKSIRGEYTEPVEVNSRTDLPYDIDLSQKNIVLTNTQWLFALYDGDGDKDDFSTNQLIAEQLIQPYNNGGKFFKVDSTTKKGELQISSIRGDSFRVFYETN